jgi:hypothetical protein
MNETGALFDQFVAPGVTYSEVAVMSLAMATRHIHDMRVSNPDDLPFYDEDIARVVIAYAQRCLGARLLTDAERAAFPGDASVNVAILRDGIWYYAHGNPTANDPMGLSAAQLVTDEDGDYVEVRRH